jgi:LacI family transcriptional regulator
MVKLTDVAEKAGVSSATASLVFNNRPGVNNETKERVLIAAAELDYMPNNMARSLAMKRSKTIGLVITDIENPFFGSLTRYIDEYAGKLGYTLILAVSNDEPKEEDRIIGNFIGDRVAGIIVVPCQVRRTEFKIYETLTKRDIPFIFSTTFYPGLPGDYVMTDLETGSYSLTKYLLDLGHREIAFLASMDREAPICNFRLNGYAKAFSDYNLEIDPTLIVSCDKPDFNSGYLTTKRLLTARKPSSLIAINDILSLGAKKAIREQGMAIPQDISVAGYDDLIYSSITDIPLTTVRQNIEEIARLSVKLLTERIEGTTSENEPILIRPELLVRESTGSSSKRNTLS